VTEICLSFLNERRLSRPSSSKRRSISPSLAVSRPVRVRAPVPRRGRGRRSRRRKASTPRRGAGAHWTGSRWISPSWSRPWSGIRREGGRLQSEALLRRARRGTPKSFGSARPAGHAATPFVSRCDSTKTPFRKVAPARRRATRWEPLM